MNQTISYQDKASSSIKWTTIGEIAAKAIVPITNMVLARLLSPEIFGLAASITVITNFASIVSESGFSQYILQQKFASEKNKNESSGTATVVSFFLSLLIFLIICLFSRPFSYFVGAPGYESILIFASSQIPFFAVTSIQIALYRRDFKFGLLAFVRVSSCVAQLAVSVAFALMGLGVWSIPAGNFASLLCQFLLMVIFRRRSFCINFSLRALKNMWACSGMFLISALVVWADSSINVLFASHFLGQTESGYIKNGFSTASGIISLLTAIYSPVLISFLAKLDSKDKTYSLIFNKYQKALSSIFIPLGIGMFVYQLFLSVVFFGNGWEPAAIALGCMGLVGCIRVASGNFVMTAWTAEGKPFWIFLSDLISSVLLILSWIFTRGLEFQTIVIIVSFAYLPTNFFCLSLCKKTLNISAMLIVRNTFDVLGPSILMGLFGFFLNQIFYNFWICIVYVVLCIAFYFLIITFSYQDYLIALIEVFVGRRYPKFLIRKNEYILFSR